MCCKRSEFNLILSSNCEKKLSHSIRFLINKRVNRLKFLYIVEIELITVVSQSPIISWNKGNLPSDYLLIIQWNYSMRKKQNFSDRNIKASKIHSLYTSSKEVMNFFSTLPPYEVIQLSLQAFSIKLDMKITKETICHYQLSVL